MEELPEELLIRLVDLITITEYIALRQTCNTIYRLLHHKAIKLNFVTLNSISLIYEYILKYSIGKKLITQVFKNSSSGIVSKLIEMINWEKYITDYIITQIEILINRKFVDQVYTLTNKVDWNTGRNSRHRLIELSVSNFDRQVSRSYFHIL